MIDTLSHSIKDALLRARASVEHWIRARAERALTGKPEGKMGMAPPHPKGTVSLFRQGTGQQHPTIAPFLPFREIDFRYN